MIRKKNILFVSLFVLMGFVGAAHAEYYKVNVKRIDQNLYKSDSGLYIETRFCYEYTYGDEAILKYEKYSYDNKLIFDSGTTCDVKKVFK